LKRFLVAFCALALLGAASPTSPTIAQMAPYLHAQRMVDIGGRRLNIYCTGSGSPTVILDSGLGGSTEVWYKVQGPISRRTRVCSYDRAGMGFSDGTTTKRDPNAVVSDLHTLLHRAEIKPPYVLVGHSIAGLYEPLYADRYPTEVAGMVLVDPSRPFQAQRYAAVAPAMAKLANGQQVFLKKCYRYLSRGNPTAAQLHYCGFLTAAQQRAACAKESPAQCALDKVQTAQWLRPLAMFDDMSELDSFWAGDSGSMEVQRAQRYYGSMPLIVLTADDGPQHTRGMPPKFPKSQAVALWKVWKSMHDQLAAYSSVGINVVVHNTGHYIQQDQPNVVISAVDKVVDQVRSR
ncbi:MAG: alpha/beta hydrolase, partial [Candidatus Eremiobacteraeota bacterium]|nr:alpha/beta hydrolase [Candidatus Eremiobacteraeota bacterium]